MAKEFKCQRCEQNVSELGAYVKLTSTIRMHKRCYDENQENFFRVQIKSEQEQAKADAQARREQEALQVLANLPRCGRCGVRVGAIPDPYLPEWGEVRAPSSTSPGVCTRCVLEEARARQTSVAQAQGRPTPSLLERLPEPSRAVPAPVPEVPRELTEDEKLTQRARDTGNPALELD